MRLLLLTMVCCVLGVSIAAGAPPTQFTRSTVYLPMMTSQTDMHIQGDHSYVEGNTLYVVGEIVNSGESGRSVSIVATFYSDNGYPMAIREATPYLAEVMPGQANPFKIGLEYPLPNITSYELTFQEETVPLCRVASLEVVSEQLVLDETIIVSGEVANTIGVRMQSVDLAATFYDEAGNVLHVAGRKMGSLSFASNTTLQYTIQTALSERDFASFKVRAQGCYVW